MRKVTGIILGILVVLFLWYLVADRLTPYTQNARVRAFVVPIVPEVSGKISEIHVSNNALVKPGELLLQIDPIKYEIAVNSTQAALDLAGQTDNKSVLGPKGVDGRLDTNMKCNGLVESN